MTSDETEKAAAYAHNLIEQHLRVGGFEGADRIYEDFQSSVWNLVVLEDIADRYTDDDDFDSLLTKAEAGADDAHCVLCAIAAKRLTKGLALPPRLAALASKMLERVFQEARKKPSDRGRPSSSQQRNMFIWSAVENVRLEFPQLHPTRNRGSKHPSACSLVADALSQNGYPLTERSVEEIWGIENRARSSGVYPE